MADPLLREPPMSTRHFLPMLPKPRPVDPAWTCQQSGECCTIPTEVLMTRSERTAILPRIPEGIVTQWRDVNERFVALKAGPCPFFVFNGCVVYSVRPFNCRRFSCMRPDPKTEAFEEGGPLGCHNLTDRIKTSRVARRLYNLIERRAQRWAVSHGWPTTT